MEKVHDGIRTECDRLVDDANRHGLAPSPYLSLFVDGCMESGKDICENSARYNNAGCHGVAIAPAADALAAVKKMVYDSKAVEKETLLKALDCNFDGYADLRRQLLDSPKMGNNDDEVDKIASAIMDTFAANMNGRKNNRGGIFRAGTGSAQEYIFSSQNIPATAEGRKAGEPYGSSFSPGIVTSLNGPLSVVQSFTKHDLRNIINGGPLTLEIHDATFRNDDGLQKVALLVKAFIGLGGHQLQLNAVNRERLIEANEHPEDYPNLIVRVWGWSGYFSELDRPFREQIIRRTAFELA
jgi:formate C-acetyltransferase